MMKVNKADCSPQQKIDEETDLKCKGAEQWEEMEEEDEEEEKGKEEKGKEEKGRS